MDNLSEPPWEKDIPQGIHRYNWRTDSAESQLQLVKSDMESEFGSYPSAFFHPGLLHILAALGRFEASHAGIFSKADKDERLFRRKDALSDIQTSSKDPEVEESY